MFKTHLEINKDLQDLWRAQDEAAEIVPCTNDPDLFFPEKSGDPVSWSMIKLACGSCPIRMQCAEYGIKHEPYFGIWGGLSERERRRLKRGII